MRPQDFMQEWQCHKVVRAAKIFSIDESAITFEYNGCAMEIVLDQDWFNKHKPEIGGYIVVYEDGYTSFSPAKAFEAGYTLSTN